MRDGKRSQGSVLLELVLIIPFLFLIAVASAEFTRSLRHIKIALSLSKESANTAFRECAFLRRLQMSNCLEETQARMQLFAANIVPPVNGVGSDIRIDTFIWDGTTALHAWAPSAGVSNVPNNCGKNTDGSWRACVDIWAEPVGGTNPLITSTLVQEQDSVVVGTAFVAYQPIIGPIATLFGFDPKFSRFSVSTII